MTRPSPLTLPLAEYRAAFWSVAIACAPVALFWAEWIAAAVRGVVS